MTEDELLGGINYKTKFSIGWRWQYMKPYLEKKEYKDAMELLISPVRDILESRKVKFFKKS